jgi:hypothetical protein
LVEDVDQTVDGTYLTPYEERSYISTPVVKFTTAFPQPSFGKAFIQVRDKAEPTTNAHVALGYGCGDDNIVSIDGDRACLVRQALNGSSYRVEDNSLQFESETVSH